MIHDSATHTFEAVLVWKLDRFSRNRYDSAHYKRILKNNRVHVVSVTEPISNTPEGIMLESLLEGMAEYYSADLAEKVSRGHKENALKAKFNGGPGAAGLPHRQRTALPARPSHRTGGAGGPSGGMPTGRVSRPFGQILTAVASEPAWAGHLPKAVFKPC